jgi:hypothetical protein
MDTLLVVKLYLYGLIVSEALIVQVVCHFYKLEKLTIKSFTKVFPTTIALAAVWPVSLPASIYYYRRM